MLHRTNLLSVEEVRECVCLTFSALQQRRMGGVFEGGPPAATAEAQGSNPDGEIAWDNSHD